MKDFFGELKRRNVYKVAVAYIVAGWALSQGIAQVFPVFDVPNWAIRVIVTLIIIGFPVALICAWAFEITPEGVKRAEDVEVTKPHTVHGPWIYIVLVGAAVSISLFFLGRYTAGNSRFPRKLPNLNDAYFAAGVQDQILTNLATVSDLKVISHICVNFDFLVGNGRCIIATKINERQFAPFITLDNKLLWKNTEGLHEWAELIESAQSEFIDRIEKEQKLSEKIRSEM
jgi:hypothetical protein